MSALGVARNQQLLEVYSTRGCKFCRKSKAKLAEIGLYDFRNIDMDEVAAAGTKSDLDERTSERVSLAMKSTVPQIYVANEYVGGCDSLLAEIESKDFFNRLQRAEIELGEPKVSSSGPEEEEEETARQALTISTGVDGLPILNGVEQEVESREADALRLSRDLQGAALTLLDDYSSEDGSRVKYKKMVSSSQFHDFVKLSGRFRNIPLDALASLTSDQRFSMFTNIYNALIIHATCVLGAPADSPQARGAFFSGASGAAYEIAGFRFSADDIEHGILRANCRHPYATPEGRATFLTAGDPREVLRVAKLDPRVHFVLNCGAKSCPPIKILPDDPEIALQAGARAYLTDNIAVSGQTVTLPKLLFWYRADFGKSDYEVLSCVAAMLTTTVEEGREEKSSLVQNLINIVQERREVTLQYGDYDWASNEETVE